MTRIGEEIAQAHQRLGRPMSADLRIVAVPARIVGRGVVAQPIGNGFDQAWTKTLPCSRQRPFDDAPDGDDVIAVNLLTGNTGSDRLSRQRRRRRLLVPRDRNCPAIIVDHKDGWNFPDTGHVQRFGHITFRCGAITEHAHSGALLAAQTKGQSHANSVWRMRTHWHANRKVLTRPAEIIATLVAPPIKEQLLQRHAAPQLSPMLAKTGDEHIVRQHGSRGANRNCLLSKGRCVCTEASRALQGDRLGIEGAGEDKRAVKPQQFVGVGSKRRHTANNIALGVENTRCGTLRSLHRLAPAAITPAL
jgi:hypothetical protein